MEHIIDVTIKDKVASCSGARYVCGNSDYVIHFDFDDEWTEFETKTARFKCEKGYVDVVFSGDVCAVPVITDTDLFSVGVYAGNIHTTTPAYVRAYKSILCGDMSPYDPPDDVYHQIMDMLNHIEKLISEYTLTQASSDEIGGVKADAAEATDTQPVRIGEDGKLYTAPGGGVSGDYIPIPDTAEVGQTIAVKAVDENGNPTEWEAAEIPAVDSTMTQSGQAADAAVVGNRLSELSEKITNLPQADFNQNDSTAADYVKNRPFYTGDPAETVLVEESTAEFTENGGLFGAEFPSTFSATVGETYKVSWDGPVYECSCVAVDKVPFLLIGNLSIIGQGSDTGEPFIIGVSNSQGITIVTRDTSDSHTFSISGFTREVVKLDEKYIPSTIQRVGDDLILSYSTADVPKKFRITVDASGLVQSVDKNTGSVYGTMAPAVTAKDNGKFLRVTDGAWTAVAITNAEEVSF